MKKQMNQKWNKWMKLTMVAGLTAICIACTGTKSFAYTQTTGTVNPATAKIRAEASTSSEAVGSTTAGKTLTIVDEATGADGSTWYKVQVDGSTTGYIRSDLVTKAGGSGASSTTAQTASATSATTVDSQAASVSSDANVRSTASTSGSVVTSLKKGAAVTITGQAKGDDGKDWYQITFANGTGFIRSDLVSTGAPATTEVSGTKTNNATEAPATESKSETEATEEPAAEEPTTEESATEPEQSEAPEETESQSSTNTGNVTVMNTEETPQLPAGFQEVAVTLNGDEVRAWKNGDFYIFYGQSQDGTEGYFMYDSVEANYQRYFMSNTEAAENTKASGIAELINPVVIVLAVILVILLVTITILTIKLNDYRAELEWGPDDDEDDYYADEDDEEEEDDEDEIEEEEVRRPVKRKVKKAQPVRHSRYEEEDDDEEDDEDIEEVPVRRVPKTKAETVKKVPAKAPVKTPAKTTAKAPAKTPARSPEARKHDANSRPAKPRNFMETDEEERPVRKKVVKKPAVRPVSKDFDPDDEDTFVFINLDGDE